MVKPFLTPALFILMAPLAAAQEKGAVVLLKGHEAEVNAVAFSGDGKRLASGDAKGVLKVWDVAGHKEVSSFQAPRAGIAALALNQDATILVYSKQGVAAPVVVLDARGQEKAALDGHKKAVHTIALTADGKLLATGSWDHTIKLWDMATFQEKGTLRGHANVIRSVAFSGDGKLLASGGLDQTAMIWDVSTQEGKAVFKGRPVFAVALSEKGTLLAIGPFDQTARLWDVAANKETAILKHDFPVYAVAFSKDGRFLASGGTDTLVRLWNPVDGTAKGMLGGHAKGVSSVAFSSDSRFLATGGGDGVVRLWDVSGVK